MNNRKIIVIAHDIRSTHNIGSLLRTCEGMGVEYIYFTGYTPYPKLMQDDPRLPHIANKLDRAISKTALGAEASQKWAHQPDLNLVLNEVKEKGYTLVALEQSPVSIAINEYDMPSKIAILIGREVEGVDKTILEKVPIHLEIPMFGQKESFNVVQATAMILYAARFS